MEVKETGKTIFFAYQGRAKNQADENVDAIKSSIDQFNQYQNSFKLESWEDYKKTTAINVEVLSAIDRCTVFVCDLTYFNHNVLFELGYAVGKNKKILILLNENIGKATNTYKDFLLKNIRYTPLTNSHDITTALQKKNYEDGLLGKFINIHNVERDGNDIFFIQSKIKNQPSIDLNEAIEGLRSERNIFVITHDFLEVEYKPLDWYFQNILKSRFTIIHLLADKIVDSNLENAKNSFFAGLACGLDKKVMLVAPSKYKAPLDYHDILVQYNESSDLVQTVINWLNTELDSFKYIQEKPEESHSLNLIKLGVGCEVAEQEKEGLLKYFIETASYHEALKREKSILVGRKGSGKSAIYIKILDELADQNLNFIISLKPESEELLEDVEMSDLFQSTSSKKTFFASVWKLVIFSKLILSIHESLGSVVTR